MLNRWKEMLVTIRPSDCEDVQSHRATSRRPIVFGQIRCVIGLEAPIVPGVRLTGAHGTEVSVTVV